MKKSIYLLTIILTNFVLNLNSLNAQYFEGGLIGGFTVSQIDGDNYGGYHQPGLTGGFYTYRDFGKNLKIQLELKYIAKGARETGTKDDPMEYSQKLRYVEVPVKANYFIEQYKTSVETGIGVGYLFNEQGEFNASLLEDPFKKVDVNWIVGANYHLNEKLSFSAQFNYSLIAIRKYENTDYNYGFFAKLLSMTNGDYNNVIQFLLYYELGK